MHDRKAAENAERLVLAPYAMKSADSKGRRHPEGPDPIRTEFQRDRDRIVHSNGYRRLQFKTQVLWSNAGDHNRNRLTHTLDVAQITRTAAQAIGLNPILAEAIAQAHDLGHTPGGHVGEEAMDDLMREHGGFDHNLNSLRVVDRLERRYPAFDGLNLTFEVREGIAKHNTPYDRPPNVPEFSGDGLPLAEAQVADCADEIAYASHDVDDGIREGLISVDQLRETALWRMAEHAASQRHGDLDADMLRYRTVSAIIDILVADLVAFTCAALDRHGVERAEDVRRVTERVAGFSPDVAAVKAEFHAFMMRNMYLSPRVADSRKEAVAVIRGLFAAYVAEPSLMPPRYLARVEAEGVHRIACDYVAGMTDRFAVDEWSRLAPARS